MCRNAVAHHVTKYTPRLDAEGKPVWTVNDNGERVMVQDPVYELDANGNKIQERDEEGNLKWANQYLKNAAVENCSGCR